VKKVFSLRIYSKANRGTDSSKWILDIISILANANLNIEYKGLALLIL